MSQQALIHRTSNTQSPMHGLDYSGTNAHHNANDYNLSSSKIAL